MFPPVHIDAASVQSNKHAVKAVKPHPAGAVHERAALVAAGPLFRHRYQRPCPKCSQPADTLVAFPPAQPYQLGSTPLTQQKAACSCIWQHILVGPCSPQLVPAAGSTGSTAPLDGPSCCCCCGCSGVLIKGWDLHSEGHTRHACANRATCQHQ